MTNIADKLGLIRAQISDLQAQEKQLKARIVDEAHTVEGSLYFATPVWSHRDKINWKAIAQYLNPSHQLITAHTKHTTVVSVRVTEKSQDAA
jgi:hypothetical protein